MYFVFALFNFVVFDLVSSKKTLPSVLWRCWLGGRKGIRPVKKLSGGVLAWLSVWSKVQTCIWPSGFHCHSLSLASVKSRLVLPFWYRPTWVVLDKGPLNGCVCVCFGRNHPKIWFRPGFGYGKKERSNYGFGRNLTTWRPKPTVTGSAANKPLLGMICQRTII